MDLKTSGKWCREFLKFTAKIEARGRLFLMTQLRKIEETMRKYLLITLENLFIYVHEVSGSTNHRILTENLQYRKILSPANADAPPPKATSWFFTRISSMLCTGNGQLLGLDCYGDVPLHIWDQATIPWGDIWDSVLRQLYGGELVLHECTKTATDTHRLKWR